MEANLFECVSKIDGKIDNIIANQIIANKKFDRHEGIEMDLFAKIDKRIIENDMDLKKLKDYTTYHGIEHKFMYALFVILFALTITLWMLK